MSSGPSSEVFDLSYADIDSVVDVGDSPMAHGPRQTEDLVVSSGVPGTMQPEIQCEHTHPVDVIAPPDGAVRHDTYHFSTDMLVFLVRLSHVWYHFLLIAVPRLRAYAIACTSTCSYATRPTGGNDCATPRPLTISQYSLTTSARLSSISSCLSCTHRAPLPSKAVDPSLTTRSCFREPDIGTIKGWTAVLRLATLWSFADVRALAIRRLDGLVTSSVDRIVLSHAFDVPHWLSVAYIELCQRRETLASAEIERLEAKDVSLILAIREELLRVGHAATRQNVARRVHAKLGLPPPSPSSPFPTHTSSSPDNAADSTASATQAPDGPVSADSQLDFIERLIEDLTMDSLQSRLDAVILWINTSEKGSAASDRKVEQVARFVYDKAVGHDTGFDVYVELCKTMQAKAMSSNEWFKRLQGMGELIDEVRWQYFLACLGERWREDWPATVTEKSNNTAWTELGSSDRIDGGDVSNSIETKRRRTAGIYFMGKLLQLKILPDTVVHASILYMIPSLRDGKALDPEDTIEYLRTLFSTAGMLLDLRSRRDMDAYFAQLKTLSLEGTSEGQMVKVSACIVHLST
jgi:hypothetical protein